MARLQQREEDDLLPRDSSFILHQQPRRQQPTWRAGLPVV
jgi:hypothetical protein